MVPKTVEEFEGEIDQAIAQVVIRAGLRRRSLSKSHRTMHPMARMAGAIDEATAGSQSTPGGSP
jgi:hypothetical protein